MYTLDIKGLIGKKINKIYFSRDYLEFDTDDGRVAYTVEGECCSYSYFYDFIGVNKLLDNGPVILFEEVQDSLLKQPTKEEEENGDCVRVYGYRLVTESPEFGEMTSVFSFRNNSNGYYGGSMEDATPQDKNRVEITDDVIEAE